MKFLSGLLAGALCGFVLFVNTGVEPQRWLAGETKPVEQISEFKPFTPPVVEREAEEPAVEVAVAVEPEAPKLPEPPALEPLTEPEVVAITDDVPVVAAVEEIPAEVEPVVLPLEMPVEPLAPRFQRVWMPFRSEASASGFAGQLSAELDTSFRVIKRGPGRYEVGFDYTQESERERLMLAVSKL